jgi:hypothetical protein
MPSNGRPLKDEEEEVAFVVYKSTFKYTIEIIN